MVVSHDRFGDGLADGVDLAGMTAAANADPDVELGEFVEADYQERFVDLNIAEKEKAKRLVELVWIRRGYGVWWVSRGYGKVFVCERGVIVP